ncbi:MAG: YqeG family HAD IIIA-type phosphatase [Syntrophomonadaceae bacterium]|nr:YqeG family HAD IIIA-type phosphatase [Syntrophomonadaceae bacterium]
MLKVLYPKIYVDSLMDVPLDYLKAMQIKGIILDLDNTVTEWNSNIIKSEIEDWFRNIKRTGFKACILSNNGEQRVLEVAQSLNIPYVHRAQKPRRGGFNRALAIMGTKTSETAVIGDQIFTDVLGGNRAGLFTILVMPINKREFMGTKVSRAFEYFVLRRLTKYVKS